jgi:hypothetical protein
MSLMTPQRVLQATFARQHHCEFIGFDERKQPPGQERKKFLRKSENIFRGMGHGSWVMGDKSCKSLVVCV